MKLGIDAFKRGYNMVYFAPHEKFIFAVKTQFHGRRKCQSKKKLSTLFSPQKISSMQRSE